MNSFVLSWVHFLNILPPLQAGPLREACMDIFLEAFDNNFSSIILKK